MSVEVTNRSSLAYRATVSLDVTFSDGYSIRGTGAIVGKNDMLTATHMLYDPDHGGLASSIEVYPGADYNDKLGIYEDKPYNFNIGAWKAVAWASQTYADDENDTLIFSESQYDVALVGFDFAIGEEIGGWFGLAAGYDTAQYAYSLGYPANSTGMMLAKTWVTKEPSYSVYSSYASNRGDLMGQGSSGGPLYVLENGLPYLIGVKSSGTTGISNHWADIGLLYNQLVDLMAANDKLLTSQANVDDFTGTTNTNGILDLAQTLVGDIEIAGDTDWFKVNLVAGNTYQFDLVGATAGGGTLSDPTLRLMDAAGKEILSNDDLVFNVNKDARINYTALTTGTYLIEAEGYQGKTGTYSLTAKQVTDLTAPTVVSYDPENGATAMAVDADIVISFNELVLRGAGTILLKDGSGQIIESYNVATSSNVAVSGTKLTINPTNPLENSHDYRLELSSGSITDFVGNAYAGSTNYQFSTEALPVFGTNAKDKIPGSKYADTLYGLGGNDRLVGDLGDDYLDGGKGQDTLIGGDGDDYYVIDNAGDKVSETGLSDAGDSVISTISYTLGKNLEWLFQEGKANINGTGNSLDNWLFGNAGKNSLNGKAGSDSLSGGAGNDKLTGGSGDDWFIFDSSVNKSNIDTITDFVRGSDQIVLDSTVFANYTGQSADFISVSKLATASALFAGEHIIYERTSHTLYYDADGAGLGSEPMAFVKLTGVSNLDANDLSFI